MEMKIVHWCTIVPGGGSGMMASVKEILEAELELGVDAGVCDPALGKEKGGETIQLRRRTVETKPWTWAEEPDAVNIHSSTICDIFYDLPHNVFIAHGMPEYCLAMELGIDPASGGKAVNAFSTSMNLPRMCEATICWSRREAEYWSCFGERVEFVERGVDLEFWHPSGERFEFKIHRPMIGFLDPTRLPKLPLTFMFALHHAQRRSTMRNIHAYMILTDPNTGHQITWAMILAKLNLDAVFEALYTGVISELDVRKYYRGLDMIVSPVQTGLMSRVATEALACGCPSLILEGCREKATYAKCRDTPAAMADAMEKIWLEIKEDPEGVRLKARRIAEKHYDVKGTAGKIIKVCEDLV